MSPWWGILDGTRLGYLPIIAGWRCVERTVDCTIRVRAPPEMPVAGRSSPPQKPTRGCCAMSPSELFTRRAMGWPFGSLRGEVMCAESEPRAAAMIS
jgi:hypothetical protein